MISTHWHDGSSIAPHVPALAALLTDAVESGASVGYTLPIDGPAIAAYWAGVAAAVAADTLWLVTAHDATGALVGTAQIAPAAKANGRHRAEVQKVLVHSSVRRRGIGLQLMQAVHAHAQARGRTLLLLDTRSNDAGEQLYRRCGWHKYGEVPGYAYSPDGTLQGTSFYSIDLTQ
ncbi:MAG: hypothetical protein RLZZ297_136 [Chloroflexota bacterium]